MPGKAELRVKVVMSCIVTLAFDSQEELSKLKCDGKLKDAILENAADRMMHQRAQGLNSREVVQEMFDYWEEV